jgi:hypothetical protein
MSTSPRNPTRRIINGDLPDVTAAERQPVRMPYQPETLLFGGWGIKL